MANEIESVFDGSTESSFFVEDASKPKQENKFIPAVPGTYVGHIVEIKSNVYDVKGGEYKARIYNFYVELSKENEGNKYNVKGQEVDGKEFVGRKLRSDGVFRYLEPGPSDSFKGRPDMNMGYLKTCEALGLECKEVEKEIDGKTVVVKQLPSITEEEILGKAVSVTTKYGKPYKNNKGFETTPLVIKYFNVWEDGKDRTIEKVDLDEIPF